MKLMKSQPLRGEIVIPGDKSISHRAVMFGSIGKGTTEIHNFLQGADCLSTISCFKQMGIHIENKGDTVLIHGKGLRGLEKPSGILDCGNSGTTVRLISGILAPQSFNSSLTGDESIRKRPMGRIMEPLSFMGADIKSTLGNGCAPLEITGNPLKGIHYQSKVASAQVKSSILLAGLYAEGETSVTEPFLSRNHTELMLSYFGAKLKCEGTTSIISPSEELFGQKVTVPGDISSAAYFIAAGLLVPGSELLIKNVGINPTRDGLLRVLKEMGADITLLDTREESGEPVTDLLVKTSHLKGTSIGGSIIPALIDEIPVIAVLACFAEGQTIIRDAQELKVKESNRIDEMVSGLSAMGADIRGTEDGMVINGGASLHGTVIDSKLDHRIAMSFAVASLMADGETKVKGSSCVEISYPKFYDELMRLQR